MQHQRQHTPPAKPARQPYRSEEGFMQFGTTVDSPHASEAPAPGISAAATRIQHRHQLN